MAGPATEAAQAAGAPPRAFTTSITQTETRPPLRSSPTPDHVELGPHGLLGVGGTVTPHHDIPATAIAASPTRAARIVMQPVNRNRIRRRTEFLVTFATGRTGIWEISEKISSGPQCDPRQWSTAATSRFRVNTAHANGRKPNIPISGHSWHARNGIRTIPLTRWDRRSASFSTGVRVFRWRGQHA